MIMSHLLMILVIILYFTTYATTTHARHQISLSKNEAATIPKSSIHFEAKLPDLSAKGLVPEQEAGREDIHYDDHHEKQLFKQQSSSVPSSSSSSYGDLVSDHNKESEGMVSSRVHESSSYKVSGSWHVDDDDDDDDLHPGFHLDYLPPRIHPPSHN